MKISGSKGQKAVHACMIRLLNLVGAKYFLTLTSKKKEEEEIYGHIKNPCSRRLKPYEKACKRLSD